MRDWKCEDCHHEGVGKAEKCDWCGANTQTLRIVKNAFPVLEMAKFLVETKKENKVATRH